MTDKEAMAMALDALETEVSIDWTNNHEFVASAEKMHEAIAALKEALAQPKQEPVAWAHYDTFKNLESLTRARFTATLATKKTDACCIALYTHSINQKETT